MPAFCNKGTVLGHRCVHGYPHTNSLVLGTLPATLKGVDKLFFESVSQLGLEVQLRYELDCSDLYGPDGDQGDPHDSDNELLFVVHKNVNRGYPSILVDGLRPLYLNNAGHARQRMVANWDPDLTFERVTWLNPAVFNQPVILYSSGDHEPMHEVVYANLVITVEIPPFDER